MTLLTENHNYTVDDICSRIGISRRNLYYYLEFFRDAGFLVENHKPYYLIRKDSPWFKKLESAVHFTEDEAILMRRILDQTGDNSQQVQQLKHKLDKLYDLDILDNVELREQIGHNQSTIYDAIKQKRMVVLQGYSSPHSNTESDRLVEPYLFLNGNQEVRCFEMASKMNKTFKLSRIQNVIMLDVKWSNEKNHRDLLTDIFMFSSEEQQVVTLRMGRLATSILREEYPRSERYIEPSDNDHWLAELPVSSMKGIGRFVLGLMEDIEVLGNETFIQYLREKTQGMASRFR